VRKWFLFPIDAGLFTVIRKRLQGKSSQVLYPFQALFWLTGGVQKYQTKVTNFAPRLGGLTAECFQLQGASPPWTPDQGLCPWTPLGALPPDPRYRLALRARHESYSRLRAFCPPHCFRPGDAPEYRQYFSTYFWQYLIPILLSSSALVNSINNNITVTETVTTNSSVDEIANVNFLYDDIVYALQNTIHSA